jgi:hypothetical protein
MITFLQMRMALMKARITKNADDMRWYGGEESSEDEDSNHSDDEDDFDEEEVNGSF